MKNENKVFGVSRRLTEPSTAIFQQKNAAPKTLFSF